MDVRAMPKRLFLRPAVKKGALVVVLGILGKSRSSATATEVRPRIISSAHASGLWLGITSGETRRRREDSLVHIQSIFGSAGRFYIANETITCKVSAGPNDKPVNLSTTATYVLPRLDSHFINVTHSIFFQQATSTELAS